MSNTHAYLHLPMITSTKFEVNPINTFGGVANTNLWDGRTDNTNTIYPTLTGGGIKTKI